MLRSFLHKFANSSRIKLTKSTRSNKIKTCNYFAYVFTNFDVCDTIRTLFVCKLADRKIRISSEKTKTKHTAAKQTKLRLQLMQVHGFLIKFICDYCLRHIYFGAQYSIGDDLESILKENLEIFLTTRTGGVQQCLEAIDHYRQ